MKKFLVLLTMSLTLGCAGNRVDPQEFWCKTNDKICLTDNQIASMPRPQKEKVLSHNEYGRDICPRSWDVACPR